MKGLILVDTWIKKKDLIRKQEDQPKNQRKVKKNQIKKNKTDPPFGKIYQMKMLLKHVKSSFKKPIKATWKWWLANIYKK